MGGASSYLCSWAWSHLGSNGNVVAAIPMGGGGMGTDFSLWC